MGRRRCSGARLSCVYLLSAIETPMTIPNRVRPPKPGTPNYNTSTTTGIEPNVAAALAYILAPITGILFLVLEKTNRFVRFHAAQSTLVGVFLIVLSVGIGIITRLVAFVPIFGWLVVLLLTMGVALVTFVLWLALMWKAYSGEEWELPVAGELARKIE
jgi:uncharacterized membrane protein